MQAVKSVTAIFLILISIFSYCPPRIYAQSNTGDIEWFIHGTGDSVEAIPSLGDGLFIARIHGNLPGQYFSVTTYDSLGNQLDLLVNAGEAYYGIVPFNFDAYNIQDVSGGLVEIKATGDWSIEVMKLTSLDFAYNSQTVLGYNDSVFYVKGSALTATIVGNKDAKYFSVSAVGIDGNKVDSDLLVNTSDPYQGSVRLPRNKDGIIVIVKSSDTWGVGFNTSKKDDFFDTSIITLKTNPYSPFKDIFVTPTVTTQPTATPQKTASPTPTPQKTAVSTVAPRKTISATVTPQQTTPIMATVTPTGTVNSDVIAGTVNRDANLRSGPGTSYKIIGGVKAGQKVTVIGVSPDESWLHLDNDAWIAAFLVDQAVQSQSDPKTATPTPSG